MQVPCSSVLHVRLVAIVAPIPELDWKESRVENETVSDLPRLCRFGASDRCEGSILAEAPWTRRTGWPRPVTRPGFRQTRTCSNQSIRFKPFPRFPHFSLRTPDAPYVISGPCSLLAAAYAAERGVMERKAAFLKKSSSAAAYTVGRERSKRGWRASMRKL